MFWNETVPFSPGSVLSDYANLAFLTTQRREEVLQTALTAQAVIPSMFTGAPAWAGPMSAAFASRDGLHAARIGMVVSSAGEADRGGLFAGKYARQSTTLSGFLGASADSIGVPAIDVPLGLQASLSKTSTTADMVDLDGDGVLEIIGGAKSSYGVLGTIATAAQFDSRPLRLRQGRGYTLNFGAQAARPNTTPGGRPFSLAVPASPDGLFGGVGDAIGRTQTTLDLEDLNGDGLPDRVWRSGNEYPRPVQPWTPIRGRGGVRCGRG